MRRTEWVANPRRIAEARMARGISRAQFALEIGVTRQAISRYEQGLSATSFHVLEKMAAILEFPIDFFYRPSMPNEQCEGPVFFRSRKTTETSKREMAEIKSQWTYEIHQFLNRYVNLLPLKLPYVDFILKRERLENEDIEMVAETVRTFWNLGNGPVDNLTYVLEKNGFAITNSNTSCDKADACSRIINGVPVIFLGSGDKSACRIRFSLAHELGHIILHAGIAQEELNDPKLHKRLEDEANKFASAFLLPRSTFPLDIISMSLKYFLTLKRKWKVSVAAMVYRCGDLGIFDDDQILLLRKQISYHKWTKVEPLDDDIPVERPTLFKKAICLIVDSGRIRLQEFVDTFKWSIKDLADICNCDESFFNVESGNGIELKLV